MNGIGLQLRWLTPTRVVLLATLALAVGSPAMAQNARSPANASTVVSLEIGSLAGRIGLTTGVWPTLAEYLGYLQEERLRAEVVDTASAGDGITGLISGSLQIVHMGSEGIIANAKGQDIIGIATSNALSPFHIMARPEFKSWESFRGKKVKVGVSGLASITTALFKDLAKGAGYDPDKDFEYIVVGATGPGFMALLASNVDVITVTPPLAFKAVKSGMSELGFAPPGMSHPVMLTGAMQVRKSWAVKNRDVVVRYLRAMIKTTKWIHDPSNKEALVAFVQKRMGLAKEDTEVIRMTVNEYTAKSPLRGAPSIGWVDDFHFYRPSVEKVIDSYVAIGAMDRKIKFEDFVDESYLEEALKSFAKKK